MGLFYYALSGIGGLLLATTSGITGLFAFTFARAHYMLWKMDRTGIDHITSFRGTWVRTREGVQFRRHNGHIGVTLKHQ